MKEAPKEGLYITMKEAHRRTQEKLCLACGKKQTSRELSSCDDRKCVNKLRPVYRWAKRVASSISEPSTSIYLS